MADTSWLDDAPDASWLDNAPDAAVPPKAAPPRVDFAQKLGEGVIPGFNRLTAAVQAAVDPLIPGRTGEWGQDYSARYAEHLRANQAGSDETAKRHPIASAAVQAAGALPLAMALMPSGGSALAEAPMGRLASGLEGMRQAGGGGAMYAAGDTRSNTVAGQLLDTALGGVTSGLVGGGAGMAFPSVSAPALASQTRSGGLITPTREAAYLQAQGVKGLTAGQKAGPGSFVGQIESVSTHNPLGLGPAREAAKEEFMRVAQNKGVAPGASIPANSDLQGRLGELFQGFKPAYDEFRDVPVPADSVMSLLDAAKMPRRGVDRRTTEGVAAEVKNALTVLGDDFVPGGSGGHARGHGHGAPAKPEAPALVDAFGRELPATPPPPRDPPKVTAGDLMKVRENLRESIRAARQDPNGADRLRLLNGAEEFVTDVLENSLPPGASDKLQNTDRQYARLMTAANAAPSGQTTFTPLQYLKRVEKAAGRRNFKKGEAGDLQDLGEAARAVFQDAPMTGFRGAVLSSIPGLSYAAAPMMRLANTPAGQRVLFGAGPDVPPTVRPPASLTPKAAAMIEALRRKVSVAPLPYPATADEEGR